MVAQELDILTELQNFTYRTLPVRLETLFPDLQGQLRETPQRFAQLRGPTAHETIFLAASHLAKSGYAEILNEYGFWDELYQAFTGHCHQSTPALGLVLKALGFQNVTYLEGYRIREHFPQTGTIEQVPPSEEPDPAKRDEFKALGRIPYCCLEVKIAGKPFYLSAKHLRSVGDEVEALLTPVCYRDFVGVLYHQDDSTKSGIYLQRVFPPRNPDGQFSHQVVWRKQTAKDPQPELFATFLRMPLH